MSVQELKRALDNPKLGITVIDVRDPEEYLIAHIPGVRQIPLGSLARRWRELDPKQTIYVHCKTGARSLQAVQFLKGKGFAHIKSVRGGINAWADEIDPRVVKY